MKILIDEHIPLMTVGILRLQGHDVRDIRGTPEEGMQDDDLWEMTPQEERLFITTELPTKGLRSTARHRIMGYSSFGFDGRIGTGFINASCRRWVVS